MAQDYSKHTKEELDGCLNIHIERIAALKERRKEIQGQLAAIDRAWDIRTAEIEAIIKEQTERVIEKYVPKLMDEEKKKHGTA